MNYIEKQDGLISCRTGDEVIIITGDALSTHILNKTAACIWELCDGTHDVSEITKMICARFDISAEKARTDVNEVMTQLEELGLIKGPAKV